MEAPETRTGKGEACPTGGKGGRVSPSEGGAGRGPVGGLLWQRVRTHHPSVLTPMQPLDSLHAAARVVKSVVQPSLAQLPLSKPHES